MARRQPAGPAPREPDLAYVPVEEVVRAALHGIEQNRPIVIPGVVMKIGMALVRLTPMPLLRLASRLTKKPALNASRRATLEAASRSPKRACPRYCAYLIEQP